MKLYWRFAVAVILLATTGLLLRAHDTVEVIAPHEQLSSFPGALSGWSALGDIPLQKDVLQILGPGEFLLRDYRENASGDEVNLFIAYFPSQRTGDTIHSPKHCLPGSGWAPVKSDRITIAVPGHAPFPANRYLIAKGEQRDLVVYWYWAHDRALASEYAAKLYLIADSIRMNRSDGSLVRITTPLQPGQSMESAQKTVMEFAADVVPLLNTYVPR